MTGATEETTAETGKDEKDQTTVVDMSNPTPSDYGKLYYAPIDANHIAEEDDTAFIDNEVLIVVKDGVSETQVQQLANKYECEIVGAIEVSGDYQLRLKEASSIEVLEGIVERFADEEIVETASLNYVAEISEANDTVVSSSGFYYGKEWQEDLQNPSDGYGKSWGWEAIDTIGAWSELDDHKDQVNPVRVGLIDCGYDLNHNDLGFAEVFYDAGKNKIGADQNPEHGTHVAGIMAAKTTDNTGICGVYPYGDKRLYGVGYGTSAYSENNIYFYSVMGTKISLAELIIRNVKVINVSQAFNFYQSDSFKEKSKVNYEKLKTWWEDKSNFRNNEKQAGELGDFLERMLKKGYDFVIVSSAGNDSDPSIGHLESQYAAWVNLIPEQDCPNAFKRIIVVGAVDINLNIAGYSNYGDRVDIFAPGGSEMKVSEIVGLPFGTIEVEGSTQTVRMGIYSTFPNNKYGVLFGTSMASPHVAGVAAMVWSANNNLTGAEVKEIIKNDENKSSLCTSCRMVDAQKAVSAAFKKKGSGDNKDPENGGVLGYVVERFHEDKRIRNAKISLKNVETGEVVYLKDEKTGKQSLPETDSEGHFEIMVPEGTYTLSVTADGYNDYEWPGGDNYTNPITVKNGEINYLDWVKMSKTGKNVVQFSVFAKDADTMEPIANKEITLTLDNSDLKCTELKKVTGKDGSVIYDITMGKTIVEIESKVKLHIDGYKDYVIDPYRFGNDPEDVLMMDALFEQGDSTPTAYENADGYIVFGHYEQDGNTENGKEPIEWVILDENESGKLLISKYVLDCVPFNNKYEDVTWETCSLREWLNNDFLNEAFSKAEQTLIPKVHLKNSGVEMPGGNDTEDQIFCLSLEEVAKYYEVELDKYAFFGFCKELITLPTEYAKANGLHTFRAKDCIDEPIGDEYWMDGYAPKGYQASITDLAGTYWWLRTMGWDTDVCAVFPNGYVGPHYESGVSSGGYGVRPVLYLKQDSEEVVEKSKLYDAFLRNEATAHFRKDADDTQQFNIKKKLSDGRAYTLDDILKLATKGWGDSISFGEPQYKYIDCGLDGVKELLVSIPVNTYAEDFTIDMIVKDIKGELSICYVCDEWSRSHTMITDSGMIVNGGSGGASSGSVEKSFVDKEGAWKKWYKRFEEGSPSSVVFNGSSVNLTDLDLESLALVKYTVDDETYCCLEQYLGREPVTPRSTVDTVKARLKKVGMKIYSSEEIETILTERKKAIGLEDEIVSYKLSGGEP